MFNKIVMTGQLLQKYGQCLRPADAFAHIEVRSTQELMAASRHLVGADRAALVTSGWVQRGTRVRLVGG